jgi:hypothetical protein
MRNLKTIIILTLFIISCSNAVTALEIIEPVEGQSYEIGSTIRIVVKPGTGEKWIKAGVGFTEIPYSLLNGAFIGEYNISKDMTPGEIELMISAISESNQVVALKRKIKIVLPSSVILKTIDIDPNPVFLYKMPLNSDPNDVRIFETKSLGVGGMYSDGVERGIASASSGTTYTSSNEKVVTVSQNGKVTAQSIGAAKIIVRNGKFSTDVEVIVDLYKE